METQKLMRKNLSLSTQFSEAILWQIKSKVSERDISLTLVFVSACDSERDNYIDRVKLRKIITLGINKEETEAAKKGAEFLDMKVEELVKMIGPANPDWIRE